MSLRSKIHDTLGPRAAASSSSSAAIRILLINPNSTVAFTKDVLNHLATTIPDDVIIDFYTAPSGAPASIDGTEDGALSAQVIQQDLNLNFDADFDETNSTVVKELMEGFSGVIVACFSMHPLVDILRRLFANVKGKGVEKARKPAVLGIMESAILGALPLGQKVGIATTGEQWEPLFDQGIQDLGISSTRYAGTKGTGFNAISLHGSGPQEALLRASEWLIEEKGADVIVLGCGACVGMFPPSTETA
ncbi:hypothetical protein I316_04920 [Kwoniella heveanensis BCC8398]|uniref:DCG1-like protein n=1 Tax=Kwoniella heveanensis BCC8398 TaxID=1296120 RepID=A0A1B9GR00_9TREE|nr:hypothetical protein I316_04920 [Kwoniella heveanensis BCC8398]